MNSIMILNRIQPKFGATKTELTDWRDNFSSTKLKYNKCKNNCKVRKHKDRLLTLRVTGISRDESKATEELTNISQEKMSLHINFENDTSVKTINMAARGNSLQTQKEAPQRNDVSNGESPKGNSQEISQAQGSNKTNHFTIITFKNIWQRRQFYQARFTLKNTGIYVNEDLNLEERNLFFKCRQLKKDNLIKTTWTKDLQIYCRLKDDSIVEINSETDIEKIRSNIQRSHNSRNNSGMSIYHSPRSSVESFHGFNEDDIKEAETKLERMLKLNI